MNTLDVTKFGVQELDHKEMVEIEGGGFGPFGFGFRIYLKPGFWSHDANTVGQTLMA